MCLFHQKAIQTEGHSSTLGQRAVPLPARSEHDSSVPREALYFCGGDQTGWLSRSAPRVSFRCPLPSAFMT